MLAYPRLNRYTMDVFVSNLTLDPKGRAFPNKIGEALHAAQKVLSDRPCKPTDSAIRLYAMFQTPARGYSRKS